jgi:hypothetical protein
MITVRKLIEELKEYPLDALAYAYEGSEVGIVIVGRNIVTNHHGGKGRPELGFIVANEGE